MKVTKRSNLTGIEHTMDLDVTEEQLWRHQNGELAQKVFPHLAPPDREFLISGITPQEWDEHFGMPDDDEGDEDEDFIVQSNKDPL
jgi:hypothetical protein